MSTFIPEIQDIISRQPTRHLRKKMEALFKKEFKKTGWSLDNQLKILATVKGIVQEAKKEKPECQDSTTSSSPSVSQSSATPSGSSTASETTSLSGSTLTGSETDSASG